MRQAARERRVFALAAPAQLPAAQVRHFHEAIVEAVAMPEATEAMARQGNLIHPMTPAESARFMRAEQDRHARLVKKAGLQVD